MATNQIRRSTGGLALAGLLLTAPACGGEDGAMGEKGEMGETGPEGPAGMDGMDGERGPTGTRGPEGPTGPQGAQGPEGPAGPQGPQGPEGPMGMPGPVGDPGMDGVSGISHAGKALELLGTYRTGVFDEGAAEIVAYHAPNNRLFVINADSGIVQILQIESDGKPTDTGLTLDAAADTEVDVGGGFEATGINSVAVGGNLVAVAVENDDGEGNGYVALYDATSLSPIDFVEVGVLPDAVTFSPDGNTVVAACEGEQLRDDDDFPVAGESTPGSVAIIDVGGGTVQAVDVLDFSGFDAIEAELRNRGVRLSPDVNADDGSYYPPSNDLEPEYAAVTADNHWAFVTLQENNAFAVVDLTVPEIVDVVPAQLKSWTSFISHSQNITIAYEDLPSLTDVQITGGGTDTVRWSGYSGMAYGGYDEDTEEHVFWVHGDRGPQTGKLGGDRPHVTHCESDCEDITYTAKVFEYRFSLDDGEWAYESGPTEVFELTRDQAGSPVAITGLPNHPGLDAGEVPIFLDGSAAAHALFPGGYDPFGGDMEGIVFDNDQNFWMVDEYRAAIYYFDGESGALIDRFVAEGTAAASGDGTVSEGDFGTENLPAHYLSRRANRGFEAVAFNPEGFMPGDGKIYAFIQSPMDNPDSDDRGDRRAIRILEFDVADLQPTAEYLYFLEAPAHRSGGAVDKIGDAVYDPYRNVLYAIERDGTAGDPHAKKYIFEINLTGATNVLGETPSSLSGGALTTTFEKTSVQDLVDVAGVQAVSKTKLANLPSVGYYLDDKAEGLALVTVGDSFEDSQQYLVVVNDNDYGLGGAPPGDGTLELAADYKDEVFGFLPLQRVAFDASDDDGGIRFESWPVLGMPMADSIASYEGDGGTYFITANEGDSRDYDEWRGDDFTLADGEGTLFGLYQTLTGDTLLDDANLGRLQCSNLDGDLDGDGTYEQLHCYGTRSFSIYDAYGNQVFDSADDLERLIEYLNPAEFNSDNDENGSFDSRSDAKGPEPEGLAVGEIDGRVFAFIGLERQSAIVVADVTDPHQVYAVDYVSNRKFFLDAENPYVGDLGPEGLVFIPAADSPTGDPLLVVGNEVSGSTSVWEIKI